MTEFEIEDAIARFYFDLNLSSTNSNAPATTSDVKNLAKATEKLFRLLAEDQDS